MKTILLKQKQINKAATTVPGTMTFQDNMETSSHLTGQQMLFKNHDLRHVLKSNNFLSKPSSWFFMPYKKFCIKDLLIS